MKKIETYNHWLPYNPIYNDHAIITTRIPFSIMDSFLQNVVKGINDIFTDKSIIPFNIEINFFSNEPILTKEYNGNNFFIGKDSHSNFIIKNSEGASIGFRFVDTHTMQYGVLGHSKEDYDRCKKFKEHLPALHEAIRKAYEESCPVIV